VLSEQDGFSKLLQRIFKCVDIQNVILTPDKELNVLIWNAFFPTSSYTGVINLSK